jgi:hypothetical protein
VVDGQLTCRNTVTVVAADLGPLEDVVTVGDPRRDLHVHANALVLVTTVEALHVAITGVALALDDVFIAEEVLLFLGGNVVLHMLDKSHLDEATVVVVPPPLHGNLLATLEVVLIWDVGPVIPTGILIRGLIRGIRVLARSGFEHVRVGNNRRGGEESSEEDVLEHCGSRLVKGLVEKKIDDDRLGDVERLSGVHRAESSAARNARVEIEIEDESADLEQICAPGVKGRGRHKRGRGGVVKKGRGSEERRGEEERRRGRS